MAANDNPFNLPAAALAAMKAPSHPANDNPFNLPPDALAAMKTPSSSNTESALALTEGAINPALLTGTLSQLTKSQQLAIKSGIANLKAQTLRLISKVPGVKGYYDKARSQADKINKEFNNTNPSLDDKTLQQMIQVGAPVVALPFELPEALGGSAIAGATSAGAKLLGNSKAAQSLMKALAFGAKTAPAGAAIGIETASPDESLGEAATFGAAANTGAGAVLKAFPAVKNLFSKERFAQKLAGQSPSTPEQLESALAASPSGNVLAGEALQIPGVRDLELDTFPKTPVFASKSVDKLYQIKEDLTQQAADVFSSVTQDDFGDQSISDFLAGRLKQNAEALEKQKRSLYDFADELAATSGVVVGKGNLKSTASTILNEFSKVSEQFGLDDNTELLKTVESILKASAQGSDLKTANLAKSNLGNEAYGKSIQGDLGAAGAYDKLSNAIKKDIQEALDTSGNRDLQDAYKQAESFFKENIVPLRDNGLLSIKAGEKDPDTIVKTFLPNDSNRTNLLAKFINNAPGTEKALLTQYLQGANTVNQFGETELSPLQLNSLLTKLGDKRLNMLVSPENLQKIKNFQQNLKLNYQALEFFKNLPTGQRNIANLNRAAAMNYFADIAKEALTKNATQTAVSAIKGLPYINSYLKLKNSQSLIEEVIRAKKEGRLSTSELNDISKAIAKTVAGVNSGVNS